MYDTKAKKILFNTFWSSAGWKHERKTNKDDLVYAKNHGTMFDDLKHNHASLQNWLHLGASKIDPNFVGRAFVSSLSSRRVELRSALSSYAFAQSFPKHDFCDHLGSLNTCGICGSFIGETKKNIDLNVLNFERLKWGGVRLTHPEYAAFDLQEFVKMKFAAPTSEDYKTLARILDLVDSHAVDATPNDLENALTKLLKSNKSERRVLIDVLGVSGILSPATHAGFFRNFTPAVDRADPAHSKNDWSYPVCWWKGSDGVNWDAVAYHFPEL